jgi:hypothetical protein
MIVLPVIDQNEVIACGLVLIEVKNVHVYG